MEGVCLPDSSCPIKTKIIVMILWPISVQEAELELELKIRSLKRLELYELTF